MKKRISQRSRSYLVGQRLRFTKEGQVRYAETFVGRRHSPLDVRLACKHFSESKNESLGLLLSVSVSQTTMFSSLDKT